MRKSIVVLLAMAAVGVATAGVAYAGVPHVPQGQLAAPLAGGNVLPAQAAPKGYSLLRLVKATAAFNTTDHSGAPPNIPFQMLYWTASGTTF